MRGAILMSLVLMLAGSCADDEQSPEDVERQKREMLDVMKAGRSAPQRYDDVVESLQVAVRSAQEAQLGRGGVGPKPTPPALKKACEDVQAAADDASALPLPHPPRYDEAVRLSRRAGDSCLADIASISAARPSRQVAAEVEAEMRQTLVRVEASRP